MRGQSTTTDRILYGRSFKKPPPKIMVLSPKDPNNHWHRLGIKTLNSTKLNMNEGWFEDIYGWSGVAGKWYVGQERLPSRLIHTVGQYSIDNDPETHSVMDIHRMIDDAIVVHTYGQLSNHHLDMAISKPDKDKNLLRLNPEIVGRPTIPYSQFALQAEHLLAVETFSNINNGQWLINGSRCFYQKNNAHLLGFVPLQRVLEK